METAKPNTLSEEHYERLESLSRILDDHIELHIRAYGNAVGLADALNAVCRLLAAVVVQTAKIDLDVFDKISGMLSYHIYEEARSERDIRVSNTN
jgi:hypothetical protein